MREDSAVWPRGATRMFTRHDKRICGCDNWTCGRGLVVGWEFKSVQDALAAWRPGV